MTPFVLYYTDERTESTVFIRRAAEMYLERPLTNADITRDPLGKPRFTDPALPRFSLSHSGGFTVCVMSPLPCGVDIQEHRLNGKTASHERLLKIARRFFHPAEAAHLADIPASVLTAAFFDLWAAKESYAKLTGQGVASFPSFSALAPPPAVTIQNIPIREGFSLCLSTEGDGEIIMKRI